MTCTHHVLVACAVAGFSCRPREATNYPYAGRCMVMNEERESPITSDLERFEATGDIDAALRAARALRRSDPAVGATVADRQRLRELHVTLWARLFAALDTRRDPAFDPEGPESQPSARTLLGDDEYPVPADPEEVYLVSPDTLPDQEARARFEAKKRATSERNQYRIQQGNLYRLDRDITPWAEEYFTSAFVRSTKAMRTVEACAARTSAARRTQLLGWVTPEEER